MHLIVLLHGLFGSASDLNYFSHQLDKQFPQHQGFHVCALKNYGRTVLSSTFGVEHCGKAATKEVLKLLQWSNVLKRSVGFDQISFIGHSLGGIVARYTIGKLYELGVFDTVKPSHFISLATPHLGSLALSFLTTHFGLRWATTLWGRTLQQLFLCDRTNIARHCHTHNHNHTHTDTLTKPSDSASISRDSDNSIVITTAVSTIPAASFPLLVVMCLPESSFYCGLALFHVRAAYGNSAHDMQVSLSTAIILPNNPYAQTRLHATQKQQIVLDKQQHSYNENQHPSESMQIVGVRSDGTFNSDDAVNDAGHAQAVAENRAANSVLVPSNVSASTTAAAAPILSSPITGAYQHLISGSVSATALSGSLDTFPDSSVPALYRSWSNWPQVRHWLLLMYSNLSSLHWRRFVVHSRPFLAHTDIIVRWRRLNSFGVSVVTHCIDMMKEDLARQPSTHQQQDNDNDDVTGAVNFVSSHGGTHEPLRISATLSREAEQASQWPPRIRSRL